LCGVSAEPSIAPAPPRIPELPYISIPAQPDNIITTESRRIFNAFMMNLQLSKKNELLLFPY
jgi:hypothetical protein